VSWKHETVIGDMEPDQRLEIRCRRCSHICFVAICEIITEGNKNLHIDEIENRLKCRDCKGKFATISLVHTKRMSAFIGGLA